MLTDDDLTGRNGTGEWHHHWTGRVLFTDGVKCVADKGGAYWLVDAIVSHQLTPLVRQEPFQVWTLLKKVGGGWVLTLTDGNTDKPLVEQHIEFSDFPLAKVELWLEGGVLMLPCER